jgi:hypothetical protein
MDDRAYVLMYQFRWKWLQSLLRYLGVVRPCGLWQARFNPKGEVFLFVREYDD